MHVALDFVFPAECQYCGEFLGDARVLLFCRTCWEQIPVITEPTCSLCGDLLPEKLLNLCKHCQSTPPSMDRVIAATYYESVVRTAIHQFKFCQKTGLGKPLGQLILSRLPANLDISAYQAIISVPLHPQRQRQRGYNQSTILAKEISKTLQIPLIRRNLRRIRQTDEQALLTDRKSRHVNIKGAFRLVDPSSVAGKAVIVVDDVVTTGATVSECARILKRAGAQSVIVLTIARRVLRPYSPLSTPSIPETANV